MNAFSALGIEIAYTETDIRFLPPSPIDNSGLVQQGLDYYKSITACVVTGCVGITPRDFTDKYTWIDLFFKRVPGLPCPWDKYLYKKQYTYYGFLSSTFYNSY